MLRLTEKPATPHAVRVRRADPSDLAALDALHAEAIAERLEHRGGPVLVASVGRGRDSDEIRSSLAVHVADDQVAVLVVELVAGVPPGRDVSEPLGHAVIRFGRPAPVEHRVAVIEELYVRPPARRIGLGSALLDHARNLSAARGCTGLDAVVLPGDRTTKNFFEDNSMTARAIIVHTEVAPHDTGAGDPAKNRA